MKYLINQEKRSYDLNEKYSVYAMQLTDAKH